MPAVGGSILNVSLDGRIFAIAADNEVNRKLGGFENEVMSNGDGSARIIKTRVPFFLDGVQARCDDSRGDHEFLQGLSNRTDYFTATITFASGATFQGSGIIVGELQYSSQSATCTFSLSGPFELTAQ